MITDINVLAYVLTGGGVEDLIEVIREEKDGEEVHRCRRREGDHAEL